MEHKGLGLLKGECAGPIFGEMGHVVSLRTPKMHDAGKCYYFLGGSFSGATIASKDTKTLAYYDGCVDATGTKIAAMVVGKCGKGKVLAMGMHPEHNLSESSHVARKVRQFLSGKL